MFKQLAIVFSLVYGTASAAFALSADELTAVAPKCKTPPTQRPKLVADGKEDNSITADFNGDGWCDFALGVPHPFNSQMESYWFEDVLILGGSKKWKPPLKNKGAASSEISSLDSDIWPTFQVDLTEIAFVYAKSGGAPYVLGIKTGYELGKKSVTWGCSEYEDVHRWDDTVDAFKKVDDATRDVVLNFYYTKVEKPCEKLLKRGQ
jgi:hypothetical protein